MKKIFLSGALLCLLAPQALALTVPSDGSDGVFNPLADVQVDLSLAANTPPGSGDGVYDGDNWAVVFNFTSVDIPAGVDVTFLHHPKRAPVVWLVQGDVNIAGTVSLDGQDHTGAAATVSESGPGGFRGGAGKPSVSLDGSAGFGPGRGHYETNPSSGGSYATAGGGTPLDPYGNEEIRPLVGGSGGGAASNDNSHGGAAGGGAILIVAGGTITVDGEVRANGGHGQYQWSGGGSGGAIRLVAETVTGTGKVRAVEGTGGRYGGVGRIRIEANNLVDVATVAPPASLAAPQDPPEIWPDAGFPTLEATQIDFTDSQGMPQSALIPDDPTASLDFPNADVAMETDLPVDIHIEATNVPLDWTITAIVTPRAGAGTEVTATYQSGPEAASTWLVQSLSLEGGFSAIQLRADAPPAP